MYNRQRIYKMLDYPTPSVLKALFTSKFSCKMDTVAFSFVFDKYYSIID
jgi:hypothetical protein